MAYTTINKGSLYYNGKLYTGTGASLSNTGIGFKPDFVWMKSRSAATVHTAYDSVRGVQLQLVIDDFTAETTQAQGLTAFNTDGSTIGSLAAINTASATYNSFNWLAGDAPTVNNTAGAGNIPTAGSVKIDGSNLSTALSGSIAATRLSANTVSGFSIVTFNGTGANATVAHGLGTTPELVIVKNRNLNPTYWATYSKVTGNAGYVALNDNDQYLVNATYWNNTSPTSTVFSLGSSTTTNNSGVPMLAYCFASIKGFSKIGGYTGNSSSNGPFVYTGFRPAWVLLKRYDNAASWILFDNKSSTFNETQKYLVPDSPAIEATGFDIDILSNGFKIRVNSTTTNGGSVLYMAFAENPFVTTSGVPVTAR